MAKVICPVEGEEDELLSASRPLGDFPWDSKVLGSELVSLAEVGVSPDRDSEDAIFMKTDNRLTVVGHVREQVMRGGLSGARSGIIPAIVRFQLGHSKLWL